MISDEQILKWLNAEEDEHVEFKEAKNKFSLKKIYEYCTAIANERGGYLVLGMTPKTPRKVIGSQAVKDINDKKVQIYDVLRLRVEIIETWFGDKRLVIFEIPSRPIGKPLNLDGRYLMRLGESLVGMGDERLRAILDESHPDFSAEICHRAEFSDLHPDAIAELRKLWYRKSGNPSLLPLNDRQLLRDAELASDGKITYAALVLLGKREALGKNLANAEVIFEYRSSPSNTEYQKRLEFRKGFFLFYNNLWDLINSRNDVQQYQEGLFVWDIPTFNERVVREAILNAISHRDYRKQGSVFIRQFPRKIEIVSPGGFPEGITEDNILWNHSPRNRRISEALSRCGLVERSGMGARLMFEKCIKESKPRPDYSRSDDYQVSLTLRGEIQDPNFLRFLENIDKETLASFSIEDLLVLDCIREEQKLSPRLLQRVHRLEELGVIERISRGRGTRYILSRRLYEFLRKKGTYTRKRGLDKETNKAIIIKHLENFTSATIRDFEEALPGLRRGQIHYLLRLLREEEKIKMLGRKRGSEWILNQ